MRGGNGPAVILLHGFPDDVRAFDEVVPPLVNAGYRTLVPYLRGHGATRFRDANAPRMVQQAAIGQDVIEFADALHKQATWPKFQELLRAHAGKDAVMVVGHNPTLSEFLSLLISGGASKTAVELRKGAAAKVEITGKRSATLSWCLTPKTLRAVYDSGASKSTTKTARK